MFYTNKSLDLQLQYTCMTVAGYMHCSVWWCGGTLQASTSSPTDKVHFSAPRLLWQSFLVNHTVNTERTTQVLHLWQSHRKWRWVGFCTVNITILGLRKHLPETDCCGNQHWAVQQVIRRETEQLYVKVNLFQKLLFEETAHKSSLLLWLASAKSNQSSLCTLLAPRD